MYADDLLIMCRADNTEASVVKECLNSYCTWSGQMENSEKSNILFSNSTSKKDREMIKQTLGFKDIGPKAIYLGNTFVFERNKTKDFFKMKERIKDRLEGWNKNLLSKSGKTVLIKSVVQAILTYTMSTFHLPLGLCEDLDGLVRRFQRWLCFSIGDGSSIDLWKAPGFQVSRTDAPQLEMG
ncbi:hypothetical protein FEM48_Zijuj06G0134600 [Ziziphus jujuba var. spinosa]|uniref:Reverse transcriptase domain-containing protein n=1 Tax=Ziziphus jujuba var. spinosa TaxID=714518 RepID=A0A978V9J5_ZIZJJ|nr:hypothetical protein FEM48_Zijuj06G0134600 [Ziziphus jujuba var. spinosa]